CLVLGGLSHALSQPTSNLALVREITMRRRGLTFGVKQATISVGTMFAGASVPLIALRWGWRWAFVVAATAPLAALVVAYDGAPAQARTRRRRGDRVMDGPLLLLAVAGALSAAVVGALAAFLVVSSVDA